VLSTTIAANTLQVGSTVRVTVYGTRSGTTSSTGIARLRIGTTTLTGTIPSTVTTSGSATASSFKYTGYFTVRSTGSAGTAWGSMDSLYGTSLVLGVSAATVAVNTTVSNVAEFTFQAGTTGNTWNIFNAIIEVIP